jgi:hypothetical protein
MHEKVLLSFQSEIKCRKFRIDRLEDPTLFAFEKNAYGQWIESKQKQIDELKAEIAEFERVIQRANPTPAP